MYRSVDRLQNDPYYIENIARRELGMVRSDELIFKFKTKVDKP
jgi:cell division protein FtsB